MKLQAIADKVHTICENKTKTFYKGMIGSNFEKFKKHRIPGFLGDLGLALVYADPGTMGAMDEPRVIIAVDVDINEIVDRRCDVDDMCGSWQDPTHPLHKELRSSIWWSTSGGHGNRGIFCGKPMPYRVVFAAEPEEFRKTSQRPEFKAIVDRNEHLEDDEEATWHQYL